MTSEKRQRGLIPIQQEILPHFPAHNAPRQALSLRVIQPGGQRPGSDVFAEKCVQAVIGSLRPDRAPFQVNHAGQDVIRRIQGFRTRIGFCGTLIVVQILIQSIPVFHEICSAALGRGREIAVPQDEGDASQIMEVLEHFVLRQKVIKL